MTTLRSIDRKLWAEVKSFCALVLSKIFHTLPLSTIKKLPANFSLFFCLFCCVKTFLFALFSGIPHARACKCRLNCCAGDFIISRGTRISLEYANNHKFSFSFSSSYEQGDYMAPCFCRINMNTINKLAIYIRSLDLCGMKMSRKCFLPRPAAINKFFN